MDIPKKIIGWWFFITGFLSFGYIGYLQFTGKPFLIEFILTLSFCGSWYALFDYMKQKGVR